MREALRLAALPADDLDDENVCAFALRDGGATVGYAGLELYGGDALLRSVVVDPARRGRGSGQAIVAATLA